MNIHDKNHLIIKRYMINNFKLYCNLTEFSEIILNTSYNDLNKRFFKFYYDFVLT